VLVRNMLDTADQKRADRVERAVDLLQAVVAHLRSADVEDAVIRQAMQEMVAKRVLPMCHSVAKSLTGGMNFVRPDSSGGTAAAMRNRFYLQNEILRSGAPRMTP
jgi:hypothetical protein